MKNGGNGHGTNGKAGNDGAPGVVRCAIYCRKSTTAGLDREFTSLDNQRESAEAFIRSQQHEGWVALPTDYTDGGFSGGTTDRPALKRLLADIEAGKIDNVILYKVDRLSRSLLDFLNFTKFFEKHVVNLVSITEPINTRTPMGRAFLNILMSFGQMEREVTAERTRDKARAARRKGKFTGGWLTLGYDRHPEGGCLVVNEGEATRVREIFRLFLTTGSLTQTIAELHRRGWTLKLWMTKKGEEHGGGAFDTHSLKRTLTNHAYIGKVAFDGTVYDGEQEAILDRETWDAVQKILDERRHEVRHSGRRSIALLAGILRCEPCDVAMTPVQSGKGRVRYRYYVCQRAHRQGWASCPSKSVPAVQVEKFVVDKIREIGADPELATATVEASRQALGSRRRDLYAEIHRLQNELDNAHAETRKGMIGLSRSALGQARPATPDQREEVQSLEDRLAAARGEMAALKSLRIDADDLRAALAAFDPVWEHMTSTERQRIVRLLIERIDYDGAAGKIAISFSAEGVRTLATEGPCTQEATP